MKKIEGIDFICQSSDEYNVMIGYKGCLYGSVKTIDELLKILCESNGRDVEGSKTLFAKKTNGHQKLGVLVNPQNEELFFPTHSSVNKFCVWINYGRISSVAGMDGSHCVCVFKSGHRLVLQCSARVIRRQMKRCCMLMESLGNPYGIINQYLIEQ